jgi:nitric oxide reductase subunit C
MKSHSPVWASSEFWKKVAIWVTAGSFVILITLTFDSLAKITPGYRQVPAYNVINREIDYKSDEQHLRYVPVIGKEAQLFGRLWSDSEAEALVTLGKKTIQAKNCMNCHTLLGNGAYYAPDLTRAWLDPNWSSSEEREARMLAFLRDPEKNAVTFGSGRKMPNLGITDEEAHGVVAFLKWMSAIDTNGFPHNFKSINHQED